MGYTFTAVWLKGALNYASDVLSHNPTADPQPEEALAETEIDQTTATSSAEIRAVINRDKSIRLSELRNVDSEYQTLKSHIISGFPQHHKQLSSECRRYWNTRTQLSVGDDLILYGCHLLISSPMKRKVLEQPHESHQGMVRTKERARLVVYWPGMEVDIENIRTILSCKLCQDSLPLKQTEPIILKPKPQQPFQEIAADFRTTVPYNS